MTTLRKWIAILSVLALAFTLWAWQYGGGREGFEYGYHQAQVVQAYESRHGEVTTTEAATIYSNAMQACVYLANEPDIPQLWHDMTDSSISGDAAATTISAAITYLCPELEYLLEEGR